MRDLLIKILLSPFTFLYGIGITLRNFFYKNGLLKSVSFDIPTISVGNLTVGGAGKTPHIEYLIRLLRDYLNVATLSRGYKRKTKGFLVVNPEDTAERVGDEPLQFKRKFLDALITVGENRTMAIPEIISLAPTTQVVLLDDAYQHRAVQPGLNILLTEYSLPFTRDILLPSGRLREWRSAYKRADFIIVTKCPDELTASDRAALMEEIKPLPHQKIYFSYYQYEYSYPLFQKNNRIAFQSKWNVMSVCAIANAQYMTDYLKTQVESVRVMEYTDHHQFSKYDMSHLLRTFERWDADNKVIVTTEKDAMRLELHKDFLIENKLPILVLPIQVAFHGADKERFDEDIKAFLLDFKY